jgi:cytochrome c2
MTHSASFPENTRTTWRRHAAGRVFLDLLAPRVAARALPCRWLVPVLLVAASFELRAVNIPDMDSARGEQVFTEMGCVQCHALNGKGGKVGPDLLRVLDRSFTPSELASTMWNHAPTMWSKSVERNVTVGRLTLKNAADLLALLYASRFFEKAGDAARGKELFIDKSCARCHGLTQQVNAKAKPLSQWQGLADPVALVAANWNHLSDMWDEISRKKFHWPSLNAQEMTDLLVYIRNSSPAARAEKPQFHIMASTGGGDLFASKGCAVCHDIEHLPVRTLSLTAIAAAMWNHATFLHNKPPRFDGDEMRAVLGYYWANQFFGVDGNAARGKKVFEAKHCVECHSGAGPGPKLADQAGLFSPVRIVSVIWSHGPEMKQKMEQRNIPWPTFKTGEMADLLAFLNRQTTN